MKNITRFICATCIFLCVYALSVFIIPGIAVFQHLTKTYAWLGSGDITQVLFLLFSLALIFTIGRGKISRYGLKTVAPGSFGRAVLTAFCVSIVLFMVNMVIMSIMLGPPGGEPGASSSLPFGSMTKMIISVWIIASTCEELFYRGFLQSFLSPLYKYGFKVISVRITLPVLFSSLTFGLGHLCLLGNMPGIIVGQIVVNTTICGAIAGYFVEKSGSIIPAIAVHMVFNITGSVIPMILMSLLSSPGA